MGRKYGLWIVGSVVVMITIVGAALLRSSFFTPRIAHAQTASTGKLVAAIGIDQNFDTLVATVDPATGAITQVGPTVPLSGGLTSGVSALDPVNHILYVETASPVDGSVRVVGLNTQSGALVSSAVLNSTLGVSGFGSWEFEGGTLTPQQQLDALSSKVQTLATAGTLSSGEANALQATLQAAMAQLSNAGSQLSNAGSVNGTSGSVAACNDLGAFVRQVDALVRSGRLTVQQGASLIGPAESLTGQMCG